MGNEVGIQGKPKTIDKRQDIIRLVSYGIPKDIVGWMTKTSVRSINRYLERVRNTNTVLSQAEIYGSNRGKNNAILTRIDIWVIERLIKEKSTIYIQEIKAHLLRLTGHNVSCEVIRATLHKMGYRKKVVWQVCCNQKTSTVLSSKEFSCDISVHSIRSKQTECKKFATGII